MLSALRRDTIGTSSLRVWAVVTHCIQYNSLAFECGGRGAEGAESRWCCIFNYEPLQLPRLRVRVYHCPNYPFFVSPSVCFRFLLLPFPSFKFHFNTLGCYAVSSSLTVAASSVVQPLSLFWESIPSYTVTPFWGRPVSPRLQLLYQLNCVSRLCVPWLLWVAC